MLFAILAVLSLKMNLMQSFVIFEDKINPYYSKISNVSNVWCQGPSPFLAIRVTEFTLAPSNMELSCTASRVEILVSYAASKSSPEKKEEIISTKGFLTSNGGLLEIEQKHVNQCSYIKRYFTAYFKKTQICT